MQEFFWILFEMQESTKSIWEQNRKLLFVPLHLICRLIDEQSTNQKEILLLSQKQTALNKELDQCNVIVDAHKVSWKYFDHFAI